MNISDTIALVTGGSRGIGRAIVAHLAQQGATVIGTATTEAGALAISEQLQDLQGRGQGVVLNVNDDASIEQAMALITEQYGAPNILINNAGITRDNLMLRMKPQEWDELIQTNLTAVFKITRLCLKAMVKKRWGRIITIGSLSGCAGNPGQANYAAAKAGVIGFSKSLALEVGARGITVNVVAPGLIDTDMAQHLTPEQRLAMTQHVPSKRMGTPDEVAAAVAFLAGPSASYITGETLHVNGGMYMS